MKSWSQWSLSNQLAASVPTTFIRDCSKSASCSLSAGRRPHGQFSCGATAVFESENPDKDIHLYINSPGGSVTCRYGNLRHHAIHQALISAPCVLARRPAWALIARGWRKRQALCVAAFAHDDSSATWRLSGTGH